MVHVDLPMESYRLAKAAAESEQRTLKMVVARALEAYVRPVAPMDLASAWEASDDHDA